MSCTQLRRSISDRRDLKWVTSYSYIIEVSILALLINGTFVNMEYFELLYDLVAVVVSLKVICWRELSKTSDERSNLDDMPVPLPAVWRGKPCSV